MAERFTLARFFGMDRKKPTDTRKHELEREELEEAKAKEAKAKEDAEAERLARNLSTQLTEVRTNLAPEVPDEVRRAEERLDHVRPDTDDHRDAVHHFLNLLNLAARDTYKPSWMTPELERRGLEAAVTWERIHRPEYHS